MKQGIKESTELAELMATMGNAADKALADGKVNFFDAFHFSPVAGKIKPALEGIKLVPAELGDLDAQESDYLKTRISDILDLENPVTEELAEAIFEGALNFAKIVTLIRKNKTTPTA